MVDMRASRVNELVTGAVIEPWPSQSTLWLLTGALAEVLGVEGEGDNR